MLYRTFFLARNTAITAVLLTLLMQSAVAQTGPEEDKEAEVAAKGIDHWRFQTSLYTRHFDPEPDHNNDQHLLNLEVWRADNWHAGLAFFDNSFDQPSQYLYIGKAWNLGDKQRFYWRVTGGLLHGYKDEYEDKIPLNDLGVAPVLVPAIGYRHSNFFTEVQLGGFSAAMITAGFSWGHGKALDPAD